MTELCDRPGSELIELLRSGEASALEIAESSLARIEAVEAQTKSFLEVTADVAREQARAVDEKRAGGDQLWAVAGIPLAL